MVLPSTTLVISNTGKKDVGCVSLLTTLIHLPVSSIFTCANVWAPLLNSSGDAVNVGVADEMLEVFLLWMDYLPIAPPVASTTAWKGFFRPVWSLSGGVGGIFLHSSSLKSSVLLGHHGSLEVCTDYQ